MDRKLIILILLPILASGCLVSKKKYNNLSAQKDLLSKKLAREQTENKSLKEALKQGTADFESMKYELHKSNAIKSDKINELLTDSKSLKEQVEELQRTLKETHKQFQNQKASSMERASALNALNKEIRTLSSDTANLRFTLSMVKERQQTLQQELNTARQNYREAANTSAQLKEEMQQQTQKQKIMEQQLVAKTEALQNISDSFIELRKSLLSAKASGTVIDPNNNKLIDKIARLLGHY